jgi:hypothetical protein
MPYPLVCYANGNVNNFQVEFRVEGMMYAHATMLGGLKLVEM